ncbi:metal-dependent hydrolase [Mycolicibacterium arseniciresistens]|uniref:Metal-dependent hydrolase n=1 Tax=Mycolicibacterium arseniciresistens TaxID=3062257 RepID=A0ABT8ULS7_9MYCO|nr:metal-dependent hydrolase [Mycolicibacterium arseniciresistens]MDO3638716.1 metal-dependent hydrolase [Mycolicibacterium arseniciresistens]
MTETRDTGGVTSQPEIRARRIRFDYPDSSMHDHYVGGDLVMSHLVAYLSATFPEGEEFFVRSVRHFADKVVDPEHKDRVRGFIGQEVTHGREHRALNQRLQQMGYPTRWEDRTTRRMLHGYERFLSPLTCLAITAALEHFTAVFAETLLEDERAQELLGSTEVRALLLWHAFEESEHRAVAFDVYRSVGGSERRRITAMRAMMVAFTTGMLLHTVVSLLSDRATYRPLQLITSLARLRHSPFLSRTVSRRLRAYNTVGFHPDDIDNTALLQRWAVELFGENGSLSDHLH